MLKFKSTSWIVVAACVLAFAAIAWWFSPVFSGWGGKTLPKQTTAEVDASPWQLRTLEPDPAPVIAASPTPRVEADQHSANSDVGDASHATMPQNELAELFERFGAPFVPNAGHVRLKTTHHDLGRRVDTIDLTRVGPAIGRFNPAFIYPGSIIDAMPLVRVDLQGQLETVDTYRALSKQPYDVFLKGSDNGTMGRIEAGNQDYQGKRYNDIFTELTTFNKNRQIEETVLEIVEGASHGHFTTQLGLGFGLNALAEFAVNYDLEKMTQRVYSAVLIRQRFFGVAASTTLANVPRAEQWLENSDFNLDQLRRLRSPDDPLDLAVPAVVKEVIYGRMLILVHTGEASTRDINFGSKGEYKDKDVSAGLDAVFAQGSANADARMQVFVLGATLDATNLEPIVGGSVDAEGSPPVSGYSIAPSDWKDVVRKFLDQPIPPNPTPIAVQLELLNSASTAIQPVLVAQYSVLCGSIPVGPLHARLDVRVQNDLDHGWFSGPGEWSGFAIFRDNVWLQDPEGRNGDDGGGRPKRRTVRGNTSYAFAADLEDSFRWGHVVKGFSVPIVEKDRTPVLGGGRGREVDLPDIQLNKPESLVSFEKAATSLQGVLGQAAQARTEFRKAKRVVSTSRTTLENESRETFLATIDEAEVKLGELKLLHEKALEGLENLRNDGWRAPDIEAHRRAKSANTFQFSIIAPNLIGQYYESLVGFMKSLEDCVTNLRREADRETNG